MRASAGSGALLTTWRNPIERVGEAPQRLLSGSCGALDSGKVAAAGLDVHDAGDLPLQVWRPDRLRPYAQNADQVVEGLIGLHRRLSDLLATDGRILLLGGNCTIAEVGETLVAE